MFTSVKETVTKLLQSPFGIVKAEEELVDPAKVLRVCSLNTNTLVMYVTLLFCIFLDKM